MFSGLVSASDASALGLKVAPLEYKTTLAKNERKRGFIDVSNPTGSPLNVNVTVRGFRQVKDDGSLQFYEDPLISSGISPELSSIELEPNAAVRMFFTVNGTKLPQGDVYATVFFSTSPGTFTQGVTDAVRVGTLLSITNQTPGERKAEVTGLDVPFFNFGTTINGSYTVRNTGNPDSGFYPEVTTTVSGNEQKKDSLLVFGGRERRNNVSFDVGYGIHIASVRYGESEKRTVFVNMAPWHLIVLVLVLVVGSVELLLLRRRHRKQ